MKRKHLASTLVLVATSLACNPAFAQEAAQSPGQAIPPSTQTAAARGPIGGPLNLRCLEWHCQGAECICIRFTTNVQVQGR
jgi:hypothetical protein